MTEHTSPPEPETTPGGGIDRRSALKKAAVGGAVAWSAPTLLSSRATAQAPPCTPKCAPVPSVFFNIVAFLYCNTNGAKWVEIRYGLQPSTCPCGDDGATASIVLVTVSGGNATFKPNDSSFGFLVIGGPGNGALGSGTYFVNVRFVTTCIDRDGDAINRFCNQTFTFTFSPGDGPCSQNSNVGQVTPGTITCDAPICGAP